MTHLEPTELKALFGQLVDAVGTQEAAATFLGVSRQRVGQLISTNPQWIDNLPTWGQVFRLEQVCGQSLVFAALARRAGGETVGQDAMASAVASTAAATDALQAIHAAKADGDLEKHELMDVQSKARRNLEAAQVQFDEAMRLRPTLRSVA